MLQVLDDFCWVLRRTGLELSVVQVADVARAVAALGWSDPATLREALACITTRSPAERRRFDEAFTRFFAAARPRDVSDRDEMVTTLHALLLDANDERSAAILQQLFASSPADRSHWLLQSMRLAGTSAWSGPLQIGARTERILRHMEIPTLMASLQHVRAKLVTQIGEEATTHLWQRIAERQNEVRQEVRLHVASASPGKATAGDPSTVSPDAEGIQRAVQTLGPLLAGAVLGHQLRARRRGPIDAAATLRAAMKTGGVPMELVHRGRQRSRPKLWVLCDISDSARPAAAFLLELVAALRRTQTRLRFFVFVSDVAEITAELSRRSVRDVLARAYDGSLVPLTHHSNYARALQHFDARWSHQFTGRSTLLIFGDGRTNYRPAGAEFLQRLQKQASAIYWLCPEPTAAWGTGDSAMPAYARWVTAALPASTGDELALAMRQVAKRIRLAFLLFRGAPPQKSPSAVEKAARHRRANRKEEYPRDRREAPACDVL